MTEQVERGGESPIYEHTYTYDQFTVFFYGGHVYVGRKGFPIGQCVVDIMNLNEAVLDEIDRRVKVFVPTAKSLLTEKNRQRRSSRTGETERCLGTHIFFTGLSGFENGRAV